VKHAINVTLTAVIIAKAKETSAYDSFYKFVSSLPTRMGGGTLQIIVPLRFNLFKIRTVKIKFYLQNETLQSRQQFSVTLIMFKKLSGKEL
jgi:hypothetical protein